MVFVPESRFSCVLLVSCMHGSDARTRTHTQGQQLRLLFFHLQCPSLPVCLVCCIPRVPNNLGSFSIFGIPHLFVSASFTTQTGSELTKRMQKRTIRSSIPPWSETFARGGFEGTACKRTAKQEPRDKIQLNKWHLFNGQEAGAWWFSPFANIAKLFVDLACTDCRIKFFIWVFLPAVSPSYTWILHTFRDPPCLDGFYPEFSPRNLGQLFPLGFKDDSSRFPSPFSGCNILKKLVCLLGGRYTNVII